MTTIDPRFYQPHVLNARLELVTDETGTASVLQLKSNGSNKEIVSHPISPKQKVTFVFEDEKLAERFMAVFSNSGEQDVAFGLEEGEGIPNVGFVYNWKQNLIAGMQILED